MKLSSRLTFALMALYSLVMMLTAVFYFQHHLGLEPCVLCVAQRIVTIIVGVLALIAVIHGKWQKVYSTLLLLVSSFGVFVAGRHVWIQSLPEDEVPLCGPSFDYIVDVFPWQDAMGMVLLGDGNCAVIDWSFLGLSIPGWTLVALIGLVVLSIWQLIRKDV